MDIQEAEATPSLGDVLGCFKQNYKERRLKKGYLFHGLFLSFLLLPERIYSARLCEALGVCCVILSRWLFFFRILVINFLTSTIPYFNMLLFEFSRNVQVLDFLALLESGSTILGATS